MLARCFWEGEDPPVFDPADRAARAENEGSSCASDSKGLLEEWFGEIGEKEGVWW
jgi:hypothetical protein